MICNEPTMQVDKKERTEPPSTSKNSVPYVKNADPKPWFIIQK